jgi:hypothetical protein
VDQLPIARAWTGQLATPGVRLDGQFVHLEEALNVDREVRAEWKKIEGKIIVSAITRLIARFAVGQGIQTAAGRDNVVGLLASLGAQATLTALDTPDTRSWETLPARWRWGACGYRPGGIASCLTFAVGNDRRSSSSSAVGGTSCR